MNVLRAALNIVYVVSWCVAFGLVVFMAAFHAAHVLHERHSVLPDDDWPLYVWPIGCGFGWWFTVRSQAWSHFHYACVLLGLIATIILTFQAVFWWQESRRLIGVMGPFSGLAEVIGSFVCSVMAAISCTIVIGSLAIIARNALRPRTVS